MRSKRDERAKSSAGRREQPADRFTWHESVLLAAATCLLVATPLIPSESTVYEGTAAPLNLLWIVVLLAWAGLTALRPNPQVKFGWTGVAAAALVALHTASALAAGMLGNGRQALNMLWQFASYAMAAFLFRQLLRSPAQCRAIIIVMVAVAAVESVQGYYEYFVSKPALLAEFRRDPEKIYRAEGAETQSQRQQLRWRLESIEPLGTFALTNSLAGLLAPWLIAVLGIALNSLDRRNLRLSLFAAAAIAMFIAGCLLLTKSRTAILATGCGVLLLLLYGRQRQGWLARWLDWKLLAGGAAVVLVLALAAVAVGGLDVQVLSEAPTSVLYRLQYWQATARLIADYPLWGCGPGQFQEFYSRYKLPQASETIADPHNFLLEIWATAGTPALLALLALAAAWVWQLARASRRSDDNHQAALEPASAPPHVRLFVYAGGLAGLMLAFPVGMVVAYPPVFISLPLGYSLPGIWLLGIPAAAACVWLLDGWAARGEMPAALPVIVLVVLVINLLAAGAVSFPGVFLSAWLLLPLSLAAAKASPWMWSPSRPAALGLVLTAFLLAVLCLRTEVSPVLVAGTHMSAAERALETGRLAEAENNLLAAAQADPWSPRPWRTLANLRLQVWTQTQRPDDWQSFLAAAEAYRARDPRHHGQFLDQGHWLLAAWRQSGDARHLAAAIDAYRLAALWYPNSAAVRAQLAWALHLAGRQPEAAAAADDALHLDSLNPHHELKLAQQTIYDLPPTTGPVPTDSRNAEQVMLQLRTSSNPEKSP